MAVVRESELAAALKRRSPAPLGLLVFGADEARVSGLVDLTLKSLARSEDVRRVQAATLRVDPTELDSALKSQSLFGDRQVVLLEGASDSTTKFLEPLLRQVSGSNFLVVTAGNLSKVSSLRVLCESVDRFLVVALYEDKPSDIYETACAKLRHDGLTFSEEASERFMSLCGTSRVFALNEAEKLALYCSGRNVSGGLISADDVSAVCGDQASYGLDAVIDAVLSGDSLAADRMLFVLDDSGLRGLLPVFSAHLARLSLLRMEANRLGGIESALRAAKPPVFFGRKPAFVQQLKAFDLEILLRFQSVAESAVEQTRRQNELMPGLISRLLISMAADARRCLRSELR